MKNQKKWWLVSVMILFASGCATQIKPPNERPQPSNVRLGTFQTVSMKRLSVNPVYAGKNVRATKKIEEHLEACMGSVFSGRFKMIEQAGEPKSGLLIDPYVDSIKFIGGGARVMVGPMAGSSAVLMKVRYVDAASKKMVAEPTFYAKANAWAAGYPGMSDNEMLKTIAQNACSYSSNNR